MDTKLKRCMRCGPDSEMQPATAFVSNRGGVGSYCLACMRKAVREWKRNNPGKLNAQKRRRRERLRKEAP